MCLSCDLVELLVCLSTVPIRSSEFLDANDPMPERRVELAPFEKAGAYDHKGKQSPAKVYSHTTK
jgi:hypothetical protein